MFKYQILIEYVGSNFRGWQIQKKGKTIQGLIQEKVSKLLKEKIIIFGSGRTDAGVHAIAQSAHFVCKNKILECDKFLKSINHFLNREGISIIDMKELDLNIMKKGAKKLVGTIDFSTFRSSSCRAKSPIKTMKSAKISYSNNKIEIEFKSQSFLQHQVRSMVGCLKYLGEKKWSLKKFESVIKSKKRILCAPPAPAEGLFLKRIIY